MASKQCPDCEKRVPDQASVCKFCGHDFEAAEPPSLVNRWPAAIFVIGLVIAVVGLVAVNEGLTVIGFAIGALGGYIWRFRVRRARAQAGR